MKVLHVPYHFDQNKLGGTEIYVVSLIKELEKLGIEGVIAAPTKNFKQEYSTYEDILINYFELDPNGKIGYAYGQPDLIATNNFIKLIIGIKPNIVHLHARSAAINSKTVRILKEMGIPTIFTYHTPTVTCPRGTMLLYGEKPCDGKIILNRCTSCLLNKHGIPKTAAKILSLYPKNLEKVISKIGRYSRFRLILSFKQLIFDSQQESINFLQNVDEVIAVCNWVKDVILINGISVNKVTLNRQGLPYTDFNKNDRRININTQNHFVIKYFGRIDESKGVLELVRAFKKIDDPLLKLEIYGILQSTSSKYFDKVYYDISSDNRIELKKPVPSHKVLSEMANSNLIAVPSKWLETGPLVVLEAFEVGVPVIGSNLGGISELVNDGLDGVLVNKHSVNAWMKELKKIIYSELINQLVLNIKPVRTTKQVAVEMRDIYERT